MASTYKKKDDTLTYLLALLLILFLFFKDKVMDIFSGLFASKTSSKESREVAKTIITREENINNLGMTIPDLKPLMAPIKYLQSIPKYFQVDKTVTKDNNFAVRDTSSLFAFEDRKAVEPIRTYTKGVATFDTGFTALGSKDMASTFKTSNAGLWYL